jgi:hypothetical protein
MRAIQRLLYTLSLIGLSSVVSGCGQDFVGKIACTTAQSCVSQTGTLFADGSTDFLPQCCGGYCVLPSGGCDSGFRFLDNDPGYGACVPTPSSGSVCPAGPPPPDMSMQVIESDMSMMPDAGGDM